jgi:hypothetical protein
MRAADLHGSELGLRARGRGPGRAGGVASRAPTPGGPGSCRNSAAGEGSDRVHAAHVEDEGDAAAAQRCEGLRVRVVDAHVADIAGLV